ncbi:AAA family ATPase [Dialister invisus]|uniref:AAA family ATPase n=1 Tax=Dialister invisus TaxID=218538 RepID=UPI00265B66F9|nr:AAA family ATPase [Dialister invisus]
MPEYDSLEEIAQKIKDSNKKVTLLYAFNATGKTRLSMEFKNLVNESGEDEIIKHVVYYNAFTEDLFSWDNDLENDSERKLKINKDSSFIDLIERQGKENEIAERFKGFTSSKIEPNINTRTGEITFSLPTGDNEAIENIKISKGEESIFIWTVFFVLMETIIEELSIAEISDRSTNDFNDIKYIFIDDPISSLDDNHAIDIALELKRIIGDSKNEDLRFIISTHHALFYNVLHTEMTKAKKFWFSKNEDKYLIIELENNETPFGYHLMLKDELKRAIENNTIQRYHFNLMRNLLEKTAHFLGYNSWKDLINEEDKDSYIKRINLYSHSNHSALEAKELEQHEKEFLKRIYEKIILEYKWKE